MGMASNNDDNDVVNIKFPATTADRPNGRPTKEELKARLSPIQYQVTQLKATER